MGLQRSAAFVAALLMRRGRSMDEAVREVRAQRQGALPEGRVSFQDALERYAQHLSQGATPGQAEAVQAAT
jgi:protein-tyrosine phosphatase